VSLVARDGNSTEKYIPREHKKNGVSKHFRYAGLRQDLVEPNFCLDQTRSNQIKYEAQSVKCHFYSCLFQVDHIVLPYRGEDALEFVPTLRKMSKYPLMTHSPIFPEKTFFSLVFSFEHFTANSKFCTLPCICQLSCYFVVKYGK
jgi:hypothetical protein